MSLTPTPDASTPSRDGADYGIFLASIRARTSVVAHDLPLFTTDAAGLFDAFLAALPEGERQHHTCRACRQFVEAYGGLVLIREDGGTVPFLWTDGRGGVSQHAPGIYGPAVLAMRRLVARAKVTGVFLTSETVWGRPTTGLWTHMALVPHAELVYRSDGINSASQAAALKLEEYGMLQRALAEFPLAAVEQAHSLLTNGQLFRSEKCIGVAAWLLELHRRIAGASKLVGRSKENMAWAAVARAPAGFCHVRTSMIGTLLEDIVAGTPFADTKRKFDAKMDPLAYQRPVAPPKAGAIDRAEAIVGTLKSAGSLDRRFARLDEVVTFWTPGAVLRDASPPEGVFGHLRQPAAPTTPTMETPPVTMTWAKFEATVLPNARAIEYATPPAKTASIYALITATNPDAPPILQWDREGARNAVSWYTHKNGSTPSWWNLPSGAYVAVVGVTRMPFEWGAGGHEHQGKGVILLLQGAKPHVNERGTGFFPEFLRSEYHEVRSVMEAHARSATLGGREEASAIGLGIRASSPGGPGNLLRVTPLAGPVVTYLIDRWD